MNPSGTRVHQASPPFNVAAGSARKTNALRPALTAAILAVWAVAAASASSGAQAQEPARSFDPEAIVLPDGYDVEIYVANLSVPTTLLFDGGDVVIAESGWLNTARPRVLRIGADGNVRELASEGLVPPVTGLALVDGRLYVSHKGRVSVVRDDGALEDIVDGLPSDGDHQNNNLVLGADGRLYLGQGTVTNTGVVGVDSYLFGWLETHPEAHDIPCQDVTLVGESYESENPLTEAPDDTVRTGAYKPFGTPGIAGETIPGDVRCSGAILRFQPDGSELEVMAWGLRNPFGLALDGGGALWATYHGADVRGSRNVFGDRDDLVKIEEGAWYGWPEFFDGEPVTAGRFDDPANEAPRFLWQDHPTLTAPDVTFEPHSGASGLVFAREGAFGFAGDAFVAAFGSFLPLTTGIDIRPAGFDVVRVAMDGMTVEPFARNRLPGPDYINRSGGFNRPVDLEFGPDGALYIVDWGASTIGSEGLKLVPRTGAVWRIYRPPAQSALRPSGPIAVPAPPDVPLADRGAEVRNVPELYRMLAGTLGLLAGAVVAGIAILVLVVRAVRRRAA